MGLRQGDCDGAPPLVGEGVLVRRGAVLALVPVAVGAAAWVAVRLGERGVPRPGRLNVFEHLYERLELTGLGVLLASLLFMWLMSKRTVPPGSAGSPPRDGLFRASHPRWLHLVVAVAVLVVALAGRRLVLFDFDLAMDEYASWFQARIFAEGRLRAPIDASWSGFAQALTPIFIDAEEKSSTWASTYLPVFASLRAGALVLGAEGALNPFLTALSVLLVGKICRQIWPGEGDAAVAGMVFFATAPQVLVNAMTGYAMPAHLAANLLWIVLWLSPGRAAVVGLPILGGLAAGLHNPFPHALFVAPFLVASVWRWSVQRLVYTGTVYASFVLSWWLWLQEFHPQATDAAGPLAVFALPDLSQVRLQAMNLALVATWQAPGAILLAAVALSVRSRMPAPVLFAVFGLLSSFAFYVFFPASQGHGWGYRYVHGALAGSIFLGVHGYRIVRDRCREGAARRVVVAGTLAAVLLAIPVRCLQVRSFAEPFETAQRSLSRVPADAIVVDVLAGWYAWDLVRNDPFLRDRPVILNLWRLSPPQREQLVAGHGWRVFAVGEPFLASAGLTTFKPRPRERR